MEHTLTGLRSCLVVGSDGPFAELREMGRVIEEVAKSAAA
jgi:hypothetical protein